MLPYFIESKNITIMKPNHNYSYHKIPSQEIYFSANFHKHIYYFIPMPHIFSHSTFNQYYSFHCTIPNKSIYNYLILRNKILMECPMCYDLYDSQQKIPRNLNCGHTVCESCLTIVYEKKRFLDCPTCRYKHDGIILPTMLSKNYVALQLACQKKQIRRNHQFCEHHDEPLKFFCEDDEQYLCVQCISEHTGHRFIKQDQNFFITKKALTSEIENLENQHKQLKQIESQFGYVRQDMLNSYNVTVQELDQMFSVIKNKLAEEHYRSKEQLKKFLERQLVEIDMQEAKIDDEIEKNIKEKIRVKEMLSKIEKDKKVENKLDMIECGNKKFKKPSVIEFPVLVMPFTGNQSFVQICHKVNPRICFFGERKKLLTFCPITNVFSLTTISNAEIHYYASACTLPTGEIFITGGGSSNTCFLFSPHEPNMITKKKSMMNARKEHSCVYLNGKVYVISGYDGKNKGMAGCEAYDIFKEEWKLIKGLNVPRCAFAATICGGKIYVFGGYDGKDRLSSIEVYNPAKGAWTVLSSALPFPLSNAAAVSGGPFIYILGGGWSEGFNQEIFQFSTETYEIKKYEKMNKGRDLRNKAIKFKNEIFTVGGNYFDGQKLDLRSNKWTDLKPYSDLVNENLDSWCCALSYNSHEYELQKCQQMSQILKKKYKDYPDDMSMAQFDDQGN